MRNYTEGRDKLKNSLEQSRQRQQEAANFDLSTGPLNKVSFEKGYVNSTHYFNLIMIHHSDLLKLLYNFYF